MGGHVGEKLADQGETLLLVFRDPVRVAGDFRMNFPAPQLFVGDHLADRQAEDAGPGDAHGASFDLHHEVGQTGHPGGHPVALAHDRGDHRGLPHPAHEVKEGVEPAPSDGGQPFRSHDIGHASPAGFPQINHWKSPADRLVLDVSFLLSRDPAGSCGEDGEIVGHDRHGAAVDLAEAADLAVRRCLVLHPGHVGAVEHAHFEKAVGVEQPRDPLAGGKLPSIVLPLNFLRPPHPENLLLPAL